MPLKEEKIKVCLVSISLGKGGLERSCAVHSEMLSSLGYDVHIVILTDEIDYPYQGTLFNLGKFKNKKDSTISKLSRFRKLRKYLKSQDFDFIIDHRPKNDLKREVFYANYIYNGLKTIYVVHSSKQEQYFTIEHKKAVKIYNKNVATVAVSRYIQEEVAEKIGVRNCSTIYNAYNKNWSQENVKLPEELQNKKYILSYGRLDDRIKDFSFLLTAFSQSEVWKKSIYLVIMGEGKDSEMLKELAYTLPAKDYILFLPYSSKPFSIITNAKFITLTSKYEGFPMVLIESLSVGTPVVALDIKSGPSEIIKHQENGLLISERSLPLFSEALKNMCFDDALYTTCKKNAQTSVAQFSMEEISKKWNQLLQNELR